MAIGRAGTAAIGLMLALTGAAMAQATSPAPTAPATPTSPQPTAPPVPAALPSPPSPPYLPIPAVRAAQPARTANLYLSAVFTGDAKPVRSGLTWRIFSDNIDGTGQTLVARSEAPNPTFTLEPGAYSVHVAYGFASAIKRVNLSGDGFERLTLSAGALRVAGAIGDTPIPNSKLTFSVYVPIGANSEGRLVVGNASPGDLIRLPEGTYHVVSTYGDSNAIMRADLKVEAGKVTDATMNHRAAIVTLKLVRAAGGEAFAGTAFSVLTPGGDVIREAIGAFPSFILAEGDYVVIARQEGQVYTREFKVQSGLDRDIEVVAK
jgi:hypothetical protein